MDLDALVEYSKQSIVTMIDTVCKHVVKQLDLNRIVETGTDKAETVAETSRWFAEMDPAFGTLVDVIRTGARSYHLGSQPIEYPVFADVRNSRYHVHSVDIDEYSFRNAHEIFKTNVNISLHCGSSQMFLASLLAPELERGRTNSYLFFLDAHWGKYWPLRDELAVIRRLDKYVVVIDDFMVPGKSNSAHPHGPFGFDIYKGRILNWAYMCDIFVNDRVRVFYPSRPNRDGRGWVLIFGGYRDDELRFLELLNLFEMNQFDERHTASVRPAWRSYLDARNAVRTVVPVSLLRSLYRAYERISR